MLVLEGQDEGQEQSGRVERVIDIELVDQFDPNAKSGEKIHPPDRMVHEYQTQDVNRGRHNKSISIVIHEAGDVSLQSRSKIMSENPSL